MALHDPVEDAKRAQEVPEGAIGAAIADEQPSKAKQFFSDPKNLATMLVLASALAQPRRSGRSVAAHALRGGVGALAFRGGLDRAIHEQAQKDAEQRSIAEARAAQAGTEAAAVTATERRTTVTAETAEAGRESAAELQALRIEAGQHAQPPSKFVEQAILQAQKDHSDAILQWQVTRQGPMPEYGPFLLRAMQGAALLGGAPSGLEFLPDVTLPDTEAEVVVPGGVPEPGAAPPPPALPSPGESAIITRKEPPFAKHVPVERRQKIANQKLRRDLPDTFSDMSDESITNTIQQVNSEIANQLETMTEEEAKAILADPVKNRVMTRENFKAVKAIARKRAQEKLIKRIGQSGAI